MPRDMQKALYWYRRAAAHGDTDAMTNIAHMYYQDSGLKRDINRAMQYYIMAAEKDHPRAQYLLGEAYETGHGLEKDCSRALYWYKRRRITGSFWPWTGWDRFIPAACVFRRGTRRKPGAGASGLSGSGVDGNTRRPKNRKRHFPACFARRRIRIGRTFGLFAMAAISGIPFFFFSPVPLPAGVDSSESVVLLSCQRQENRPIPVMNRRSRRPARMPRSPGKLPPAGNRPQNRDGSARPAACIPVRLHDDIYRE